MEGTPISDKNNLSLDSYGTGFLENFIYEIGLLLDSEIPVYGFTNSQRIEIAINRYISQSARIRELEGVLEKCNEIFLLALIWDNGTLSEALEKGVEYIKQALNKKEQL